MKQPIVALEFGGSAIKLVIGYALEGQPFVLYSNSSSIAGAINHGVIVNRETIITKLKQMLAEAEKRTGIKIEKVIFALPSFGLDVFETIKEINTVSDNNRVEKVDINHLMNMIRREVVEVNQAIVAIVPEIFTIVDSGNQYDVPPIGETGNLIRLRAKIHALPKQVIDDYTSILEAAGVGLTKYFVDQYALGRLYEHYENMPPKFLLVDIGYDITHVTFFAFKQVYSTIFFPKGSQDLFDAVATKLVLPVDKAEEIVTHFGYDTRELTYNPRIATSINLEGSKSPIIISDLRKAIGAYLSDYISDFQAAINAIVREQNGNRAIADLPVYLTGGGSRLHHLIPVFNGKLPIKNFSLIAPATLGARHPRFAVCLGLIKVYDEYSRTIFDEKMSVSPVTRDLNRPRVERGSKQ